jgi:hypothetical protein
MPTWHKKYQNFRVQSFDKTEIFVNDVALLALENPPKLPRDQVTCFFVYKIENSSRPLRKGRQVTARNIYQALR